MRGWDGREVRGPGGQGVGGKEGMWALKRRERGEVWREGLEGEDEHKVWKWL